MDRLLRFLVFVSLSILLIFIPYYVESTFRFVTKDGDHLLQIWFGGFLTSLIGTTVIAYLLSWLRKLIEWIWHG